MKGFVGHVKNPDVKFVSTDSFKSISTYWTYFITPPDLKCSSENVVSLFTCKSCSKQYKGALCVPTENF